MMRPKTGTHRNKSPGIPVRIIFHNADRILFFLLGLGTGLMFMTNQISNNCKSSEYLYVSSDSSGIGGYDEAKQFDYLITSSTRLGSGGDEEEHDDSKGNDDDDDGDGDDDDNNNEVINQESRTIHVDLHQQEYKPASLEQYFKDNMETLGLNWTIKGYSAYTCHIWRSENVTSPEIFKDLMAYAKDLDDHSKAIQKFKPIPDLLKEIKAAENYKAEIETICKKARPHPDGLKALFPSNQLSFGRSGYIDPLLAQMRHHKICEEGKLDEYMLNLDYLVHDFESMCRSLKPTSRRILIDMGASLEFHDSNQPIVTLLNLYEKFGFHFDHIYGFEITPMNATDVYTKFLPEKYIPAYHWINLGVTHTKGKIMNPLHSIIKSYDEDDLIIVKLDVDATLTEKKLARQLLDDEDGIYGKLVDHFYFEDHVFQRELSPFWLGTMKGTIQESFDLFYELRKKGIASHYWV